MVVFSVVLLASSVLTISPADSFDGIQLYLNWVMVYIFLANVANTEARFLVFTGGQAQGTPRRGKSAIRAHSDAARNRAPSGGGLRRAVPLLRKPASRPMSRKDVS